MHPRMAAPAECNQASVTAVMHQHLALFELAAALALTPIASEYRFPLAAEAFAA